MKHSHKKLTLIAGILAAVLVLAGLILLLVVRQRQTTSATAGQDTAAAQTGAFASPAELAEGTATTDGQETRQLQLLVTSDMHGKFLPYDYALNAEDASGSCAQLTSAVRALRREDAIVLDGGDIIQDNGAELFLSDSLHPMMLAMNYIGYDAWTVGNHEFDYGTDVLQAVIPQNNAQLLCGNVYNPDGEPLGADYCVLQRDGIKIGVIGMVTPNITRWDAAALKGWIVTNPVEETRAAIAELKDEVDVLIALVHMDVYNEYDTYGSGAYDLANACPELDLIIAAHGHQAIEDFTVNGVPILENRNACATLGEVLLDLVRTEDGWKVASTSVTLHDVSSYAPDEELTALLQPYHERAIAYAESVIGTLDADSLAAPSEIADIPTAFIEDTALVDLINEVQLYYSGAKVSATALGATNANIYRGDIRRCDMSLIYKYANSLYTVEMTGWQLKRWMEWSASYYNTFHEGDLTVSFNPDIRYYLYDMFSGVSYDIDISEEPGSRIKNLTWPDGTPVKDDEVFTVAVNHYRAGSALTTSGTIFGEEEELPKILEIDVCGNIGGIRDLICDYIINVKGGVITAECDHNWQLTGISWDEDLHEKAVALIREGKLSVPAATDGRTLNVKSITVEDLRAVS